MGEQFPIHIESFQKNVQLAQRIHTILSPSARTNPELAGHEGLHVSYHNRDRSIEIDFAGAYKPEHMQYDVFWMASDSLSRPIFKATMNFADIGIFNYPTPFGQLPRFFINSDGSLFHTEVVYLLTYTGRGEKVVMLDKEADIVDVDSALVEDIGGGYGRDDIPIISDIPEGNYRMLLTNADYGLLDYYIRLIEQGKFLSL